MEPEPPPPLGGRSMKTIHHVVDLEAPPGDVWAAIATESGLGSWWSTEVSLESPGVGEVVDFTFVADFNPDMKITTFEPLHRLEWCCVGGHPPWSDNTFTFELDANGDGTRLRFWQHYATELDDDEYGIYNFNWGYYLQSMLEYLTTGTGKPFTPEAST